MFVAYCTKMTIINRGGEKWLEERYKLDINAKVLALLPSSG